MLQLAVEFDVGGQSVLTDETCFTHMAQDLLSVCHRFYQIIRTALQPRILLPLHVATSSHTLFARQALDSCQADPGH